MKRPSRPKQARGRKPAAAKGAREPAVAKRRRKPARADVRAPASREREEASRAKRPRASSSPAIASNGAISAAECPPRPNDEPIRLLSPDGAWQGPGRDSGLPPELLLSLHRGMTSVRVIDGRMLMLQRQGRIGFYGQATGQEASIIGSAAAVGPQDWVAPALREAGVAIWRGLPLDRMVAQCMGRTGDGASREPSQGRQMPCHHTFKEGRFVAMSSVIATQLLHATGLALAARIRKDPVVAMAYLGDGATSEHDFHCALNFAAVKRAPVVFFCQNNQWAISVPVSRQTASKTIAIKAVAYGIPGVRVDGNDVLAVYLETKRAVDRAREGGGPTLIEALTYRRMGHSSSDDPTRYRREEEVKHWTRLDPLDRFRRHLRKLGLLSEEEARRVEDELEAEISEAIRVAEQARDPAPASLFDDVFAELTPQLQQQRDELLQSLDSQREAPPSAPTSPDAARRGPTAGH